MKRAEKGVGLVALALAGAFLFWKRETVRPRSAAHASSPRIAALSLCDQVSRHLMEHGTLASAGPWPRHIPHGEQVLLPLDEAFVELGFTPDPSGHFQYEVQVLESPVGELEGHCLVRSDSDGDGNVSVATVKVDAQGRTSAVQVENEGE